MVKCSRKIFLWHCPRPTCHLYANFKWQSKSASELSLRTVHSRSFFMLFCCNIYIHRCIQPKWPCGPVSPSYRKLCLNELYKINRQSNVIHAQRLCQTSVSQMGATSKAWRWTLTAICRSYRSRSPWSASTATMAYQPSPRIAGYFAQSLLEMPDFLPNMTLAPSLINETQFFWRYSCGKPASFKHLYVM